MPKTKSWTEEWVPANAITVNTLKVEAKPEYVAWIDLMGAKSWMADSIRRAAEIVGIIHLAGLRAAKDNGVKVYPVIDGAYLVGESKTEFRQATRAAMRALALTFLSRESQDRFLVRGGIAYGRILHGAAIAGLHNDLKRAPTYSQCLALGVSIGQAYAAESKAPPFGYYVDMTARSTASANDTPYVSSYFRWWSETQPEQLKIASDFGVELNKHFAYLRERHREIEYQADRLSEHHAAAREYFHIGPELGGGG